MNINATLLGQTLAFVIFVAICWKYVWPPIIAIMEEREKRIADGLEAAKKADDSLEEAQLAFDEEMNKAKLEAAEILEKLTLEPLKSLMMQQKRQRLRLKRFYLQHLKPLKMMSIKQKKS